MLAKLSISPNAAVHVEVSKGDAKVMLEVETPTRGRSVRLDHLEAIALAGLLCLAAKGLPQQGKEILS